MNHFGNGQNLHIRRLWAVDQQAIRSHFLRLDEQTRRSRFGGAISDESVGTYASRILRYDSVVCGAFVDAELRAIAELRGEFPLWRATAEAAFSVETGWQNIGIGDALFERLITIAQNRGIETLHLICMKENQRMKHLAAKHHAQLEISPDAVEATLNSPWPTAFSVAQEVAGETKGLVCALHPFLGDNLYSAAFQGEPRPATTVTE